MANAPGGKKEAFPFAPQSQWARGGTSSEMISNASNDLGETKQDANLSATMNLKSSKVIVKPADDNIGPKPSQATSALRFQSIVWGEHTKQIGLIKKILIRELKGSFLLENVFSIDECKQLQQVAMSLRFAKAKVSGEARDTIRNNSRAIMDVPPSDLQNTIWKRISTFVPAEVRSKDKLYSACGINNKVRFYRYEEGEYFRPHYDWFHTDSSDNRSWLSFLVYLNSETDSLLRGGETCFYGDDVGKHVVATIKPKTGMAVLFFHGDHPNSPLHEGYQLRGGKKFVFRSEIMYRVCPKPSVVVPERKFKKRKKRITVPNAQYTQSDRQKKSRYEISEDRDQSSPNKRAESQKRVTKKYISRKNT